MSTSTQTYPDVSTGGLSFTNINVSEVDTGTVGSFTSAPVSDLSGITNGSFSGLDWGSFNAGAYGPGSSEALTFNFTVTATTPGEVIDSLSTSYLADLFAGPGDHLTATETVYDTSGNIIATQNYDYLSTPPAAVTFVQGQQAVNVTITVTESVDPTGLAGGSGVDMSGIQFTYGQAATSALCSIGDIVFLDQNGTGLESGFDTGPGVAGVTVELLDSTGTNILSTTTTDSNGIYAFNNLQAGTYEVKFVAPNGYTFSPEGVGGNPAVNSSADQTTGVTAPITLTAGEHDHNVEAGLVPPPTHTGGTAALGDYVWFDANGNGLQDSSESGVAGVTVELLNGTGTSVLATTTTDSTGYYAFTNLNAGTYEVEFVAPNGDTFTTQTAGSNRAIDSNANVSTGITAPITLTAGQIDSTIDAGLIGTGGISILKTPCKVVVNACGQISYSFGVTNTGSAALKNIGLKDNVGTASKPSYITPQAVTTRGGYNVGDANHNGLLDKGETWQYSVTVTAPSSSCGTGGSYGGGGNDCGGYGSGGNNNYCGSGGYNYSNGCGGYSYGGNGSDCGGNYGYGGGYNSGCGSSGGYGGGNDCGSYNYSSGCGGYSSSSYGHNDGGSYGGNGGYCGSGSYGGNSGGYGGGNDCGGYNYSSGGGGYGSGSYSHNYGGSNCGGSYSYGDYSYGDNGSYCGYGGNSGGYGGGNDCGGSYNYSNGCGGYGSGSYGHSGNGNDCGGGYSGGYGGDNNCGGGYSGGGNDCGSSGQTCVTGVADTVTVTAKTSSGQTVTASDTKEVLVLGSSSNVSLDGSTPTGSLSSLYGTAKTLEFSYSPGNTVSTKTISAGLASVSGSNSSGMAFMEISNNSNPFASNAKIYFEGEVTTGEKIFADSTTNPLTNTAVAAPNNHFDTTAGADIFAYVFASQQAFAGGAAPIQTMAYNTSGSKAMHFGDVIGSLKVVGYVGSNGGHLAS